MVNIRVANITDAEGICEIYAPYITDHPTSFEMQPPERAEMESRITKYLDKYPWIVCRINGRVAAYAYGSTFKEREAYQWCCETSVYVHDQYQGLGIGSELYGIIIPILKIQGFRNAYAGITLPNQASVRLHEKFGFKLIAVYENVGYKLDNWQNVGWWKLQLNDYTLKPSPPIKFSHFKHALSIEATEKAAASIHSRIIY